MIYIYCVTNEPTHPTIYLYDIGKTKRSKAVAAIAAGQKSEKKILSESSAGFPWRIDALYIIFPKKPQQNVVLCSGFIGSISNTYVLFMNNVVRICRFYLCMCVCVLSGDERITFHFEFHDVLMRKRATGYFRYMGIQRVVLTSK